MSSDYFSLADDYEALGEELSPELLEDSTYTVQVVRSEAATTSAGKPCIRLGLKVLEGPRAGYIQNDQLTWSPESPVAARIFSQSLGILGAPAKWVKEARPSMEEIAARIMDSVVVIATKIKPVNGEDRVNVNYRRAVSTAAGGPAGPAAPVLGAPPAAPVLGAVPPQAQAPQAPQAGEQPPAVAPQGFAWPGAPAN